MVESSPGHFHAYYRLTEAIPPERAEALNKRLAHMIGADASGWDLSQLLRVPGTMNHKRNEPAPAYTRPLQAAGPYVAQRQPFRYTFG